MKDSKNNILTPLELVERYFKKYMEFKELYFKNEPSKEDIKKEFQDLIESNTSSDQVFKEKAKGIWIDNVIRFSDLQFLKNKFLNAADNYILTNKEDLSEEIVREFVQVKKTEYKPMFSIELGKFVENTKSNLNNIPQQEFDNIFNAIKLQIEKY